MIRDKKKISQLNLKIQKGALALPGPLCGCSKRKAI